MVGTFVLSSGYYDAFYAKACRVRQSIRRDFEAAYESVDALICPTSPVPAFSHRRADRRPSGALRGRYSDRACQSGRRPWSFAPCGSVSAGLPIGMQLFGRHFEDDVLLGLRTHISKRPLSLAASASGGVAGLTEWKVSDKKSDPTLAPLGGRDRTRGARAAENGEQDVLRLREPIRSAA